MKDTKVSRQFNIYKSQDLAIKQIAKDQGTSVSAIIRQLITDYLDDNDLMTIEEMQEAIKKASGINPIIKNQTKIICQQTMQCGLGEIYSILVDKYDPREIPEKSIMMNLRTRERFYVKAPDEDHLHINFDSDLFVDKNYTFEFNDGDILILIAKRIN